MSTGRFTLLDNSCFFFYFRRGPVWFEHSIGAVRRCWSTSIEEKFQWNLMVSPLLFSTQRYLSLSLRKSIQLAIGRSTTITVDSLISALNASDNYKTQEKIHWIICSITNYTKIFPIESLHRNRFFTARNSLHWTKRQHAQTQERILNLLQREFFCQTTQNIEQLCASHQTLLQWKWQILPFEYSVRRQGKSNNRHDQGIINRTLTQKSDSRKHWEKQKTIVVNINSSTTTNKICNYHKKSHLEHDENTRGTRAIK